jgi:hypothetical protein
MKLFLAGQPEQQAFAAFPGNQWPVVIEAMKALPHAIHAHFLTKEAPLWSSLQPENLTIPTSDLTLKYGGTISGVWKLLYMLDAWPDAGTPPSFEGWSAGPVMDGIVNAMHVLKTGFGRPGTWCGVTPLMIFRSAAGWLPQSTAPADPGVAPPA